MILLKRSPPQGLSESVSTGVWCVPGFGVGFEIALKPSKLQKEGENPGKGHLYFRRQTWYAPNPWFLEGCQGNTHKAQGKSSFVEKVLKVMTFRVLSGNFRKFQGIVRLFSGCFCLCSFRVCPLDPSKIQKRSESSGPGMVLVECLVTWTAIFCCKRKGS